MLERISDYFGNTPYVLVLLFFMAGLMINRKKENCRQVLLACALFTVLYPIMYIVCKQIGLQEESYRFLWLLPLSLIWALGMVLIWQKYRFRLVTGILLIIMSIAVLGSILTDTSTWKRVSNLYSLEDEVIEIAGMLEDEAGDRYVRVLAEPSVMMQIRQYSSKIQWAYSGRDVMIQAQNREINEDLKTNPQYRLAMAVQQDIYVDEAALLNDICELQVDYLVLSGDNSFIEHLPEYVYEKYDISGAGTDRKYNLYRIDRSLASLEGFFVDKKAISVPGLEASYRLVFVNDMHIVSDQDVINPDNDTEMLQQRYDFFSLNRTPSYGTWQHLYPQLDQIGCDGIVFNGDMLDFYSDGNFSILRKGMDQIQTPHIYLRADHDVSPYWCREMDAAYIDNAEDSLDGNPEVAVLDYGELLVVGINMNTDQISHDAVERIAELFEQNIPVVIVAHVPFESVVDDSLADASKAAWSDRVLLWGNEEADCYKPDTNTARFLELLYAEDSPVIAVVGAHLHFAHESMLTEQIPEYIFDASYKGSIGLLEIKGEE